MELRSTKHSVIIGLGHPTSHARNGTPNASASAARGRQSLIFDREYLPKYWRYRDHSFGVGYPSPVSIQRPWPRGGWVPKFGGHGPPTKILLFSTLTLLAVREINVTYRNCRHPRPLPNPTILGHAHFRFRRQGALNDFFRSRFSRKRLKISTPFFRR